MTPEIILAPDAVVAALRFRDENTSFQGLDLRVYLSGKGCDGFEYGVSFDAREPEDRVFVVNKDLSLICDERTLEFVSGSTIIWVDDERGRGFLVENPGHKKFRGKFYKKSAWITRLTGSSDAPQ